MKKSVIAFLFVALFGMNVFGQTKTKKVKRNAKAARTKSVKAPRRVTWYECFLAAIELTEAEKARCSLLRRNRKLPRH